MGGVEHQVNDSDTFPHKQQVASMAVLIVSFLPHPYHLFVFVFVFLGAG